MLAPMLVLLPLGACGTDDDRSGGEGVPAPTLALDVVSPELVRGASVTWSLTIRNTTDRPVELTCPTGQEADVVLRRSGATRYRWSEGRFFTQRVRHVRVPPEGMHIEVHEETLDVAPGSYVLEATIACDDPAPDPVRTDVEVAASSRR